MATRAAEQEMLPMGAALPEADADAGGAAAEAGGGGEGGGAEGGGEAAAAGAGAAAAVVVDGADVEGASDGLSDLLLEVKALVDWDLFVSALQVLGIVLEIEGVWPRGFTAFFGAVTVPMNVALPAVGVSRSAAFGLIMLLPLMLAAAWKEVLSSPYTWKKRFIVDWHQTLLQYFAGCLLLGMVGASALWVSSHDTNVASAVALGLFSGFCIFLIWFPIISFLRFGYASAKNEKIFFVKTRASLQAVLLLLLVLVYVPVSQAIASSIRALLIDQSPSDVTAGESLELIFACAGLLYYVIGIPWFLLRNIQRDTELYSDSMDELRRREQERAQDGPQDRSGSDDSDANANANAITNMRLSLSHRRLTSSSVARMSANNGGGDRGVRWQQLEDDVEQGAGGGPSGDEDGHPEQKQNTDSPVLPASVLTKQGDAPLPPASRPLASRSKVSRASAGVRVSATARQAAAAALPVQHEARMSQAVSLDDLRDSIEAKANDLEAGRHAAGQEDDDEDDEVEPLLEFESHSGVDFMLAGALADEQRKVLATMKKHRATKQDTRRIARTQARLAEYLALEQSELQFALHQWFAHSGSSPFSRLSMAYDRDKHYWRVVQMLEKIALIFCVVFIDSTGAQLFSTLAIVAIMLCAAAVVAPYRDEKEGERSREDKLDTFSRAVTFLTLLLAIILWASRPGAGGKTAIDVVLIFVNVMSIMLLLHELDLQSSVENAIRSIKETPNKFREFQQARQDRRNAESLALFNAVEQDNVYEVRAVLFHGVADVNWRNPKDLHKTPTHVVHSPAVLQELLAHGADLRCLDADNKSALHYAYANARGPCVEMLLTHNCDVEVRDRHSRQAHDYLEIVPAMVRVIEQRTIPDAEWLVKQPRFRKVSKQQYQLWLNRVRDSKAWEILPLMVSNRGDDVVCLPSFGLQGLGMMSLAPSMMSMRHLRELDLSGNSIANDKESSERVIRLVARVLARCKNLRFLDLRGNNITNDMSRALLEPTRQAHALMCLNGFDFDLARQQRGDGDENNEDDEDDDANARANIDTKLGADLPPGLALVHATSLKGGIVVDNKRTIFNADFREMAAFSLGELRDALEAKQAEQSELSKTGMCLSAAAFARLQELRGEIADLQRRINRPGIEQDRGRLPDYESAFVFRRLAHVYPNLETLVATGKLNSATAMRECVQYLCSVPPAFKMASLHSSFLDMIGARALAKALRQNPNVQCLSLTHCVAPANETAESRMEIVSTVLAGVAKNTKLLSLEVDFHTERTTWELEHDLSQEAIEALCENRTLECFNGETCVQLLRGDNGAQRVSTRGRTANTSCLLALLACNDSMRCLDLAGNALRTASCAHRLIVGLTATIRSASRLQQLQAFSLSACYVGHGATLDALVEAVTRMTSLRFFRLADCRFTRGYRVELEHMYLETDVDALNAHDVARIAHALEANAADLEHVCFDGTDLLTPRIAPLRHGGRRKGLAPGRVAILRRATPDCNVRPCTVRNTGRADGDDAGGADGAEREWGPFGAWTENDWQRAIDCNPVLVRVVRVHADTDTNTDGDGGLVEVQPFTPQGNMAADTHPPVYVDTQRLVAASTLDAVRRGGGDNGDNNAVHLAVLYPLLAPSTEGVDALLQLAESKATLNRVWLTDVNVGMVRASAMFRGEQPLPKRVSDENVFEMAHALGLNDPSAGSAMDTLRSRLPNPHRRVYLSLTFTDACSLTPDGKTPVETLGGEDVSIPASISTVQPGQTVELWDPELTDEQREDVVVRGLPPQPEWLDLQANQTTYTKVVASVDLDWDGSLALCCTGDLERNQLDFVCYHDVPTVRRQFRAVSPAPARRATASKTSNRKDGTRSPVARTTMSAARARIQASSSSSSSGAGRPSPMDSTASDSALPATPTTAATDTAASTTAAAVSAGTLRLCDRMIHGTMGVPLKSCANCARQNQCGRCKTRIFPSPQLTPARMCPNCNITAANTCPLCQQPLFGNAVPLNLCATCSRSMGAMEKCSNRVT